MIGMQIAAAGNGLNSLMLQQELPQESIRQAQQQRELKAAARASFESSLPGNRRSEERREKNPADIRAVTAALENVSNAFSKKLRFVVDHESHEITVKVIDSETDKVIKTLPPEELQRMHRRIRETIGFLFDEKI